MIGGDLKFGDDAIFFLFVMQVIFELQLHFVDTLILFVKHLVISSFTFSKD